MDEVMPYLAGQGFALERSRPDLVRLVSRTSFVEVFYDARSGEVGIEIGPPEIQPLEDRDPAEFAIGRRVRPGVVSLDDVIRYACEGHLDWMEALVRCAGPFLRGDRAAFARVEAASERAGRAMMERMRLEDLRAAAARAWEAKDYAAAARALDSLGEQRTAAEEAKLQYARKRATGP